MNKLIPPPQRIDIHEILGRESVAVSSRLLGWMRHRALAWSAVAVAVTVSLALVWWFVSGAGNVRYYTQPVTRGGLIVVVTATGSIQPTKKVDVSSELSGTVRRVLVDYNSVVEIGQTLAELDTSKLEATVNSSRARLAATRAKVSDAQATVGEKERDVARKKLLLPGRAVSVQDLDQSQSDYDRAIAALASTNADVQVAEAELQLNETNLAKAKITSPINGIVLKRDVDPGQTVASSLQAPVLFSIAEDLKQMELQVDVDEADVGKVNIGQTASFSVDAFPEHKFPASIRIVRFAPETIQGVVTYKAVLSVDNSEMLLRPGMTATAEIVVTEVKDALLIPNSALRYAPGVAAASSGRSFLSRLMPVGRSPFRPSGQQEQSGQGRTVWVMTDEEPAQVKIGIGSTDGTRTELTGGALHEGQLLVVGQTTAKQ